MFKEFKEFAMRGNVVDMAIGIIIGAAFGKIITSFVADLLMPPLGLITGGFDFKDKLITLQPATATAKAITLNYGVFIMTIVDFIIVAFAIFLLVRAMNSLKRKEEAAAPTTKDCPECMMPIPLQARRCAHCTVVLQ
jgi:large conductance mechanosensitive channel